MKGKAFQAITDGDLISDRPGMQVRQLANLRWLHFGSQAIQALVDLNNPAIPQLAYGKGMSLAMLLVESPKSVLNLGLGAGTFERFWAEFFPELSVLSIDQDEELIEISKEFFCLPECSGHRIEIADARAIVLREAELETASHDLIFSDLFDANSHPQFYYQRSFYAGNAKALSSTGLLTMNILPADQQDLVRILLPLRDEFTYVAALEFKDHKNVILYASNMPFPEADEIGYRAQRLFALTGLDLRSLLSDFFVFPLKETT